MWHNCYNWNYNKKTVSPRSNLSMDNFFFFFEFTPKKSSAGGTLLYIADHLS